MAPFTLLEPENSLGPEDGCGQLVVEEILKQAQIQGLVCLKRQRCKALNGPVMGVVVIMVTMIMSMVVVAVIVTVAVFMGVMGVPMAICFMTCPMGVLMPMVMGVAVVMPFGVCLFGGDSVGFKQPHTQQQRQLNIALDGMENPWIAFDIRDHGLDLLHPLTADQIGLV